MNRNIRFLTFLLVISVLSSCREKNISEVKLIPVKSGKVFQYIDNEGKIVINPQFSEATIFREGLALVRTAAQEAEEVVEEEPASEQMYRESTSDNEPKYGFISEDGKYAISPNYLSATVFSEGLAWVVSKNGPPTAINSKGEIKFKLQEAEYASIFKDGLSAFCIIDSSGGKWGFVNQNGKITINPQFSNTMNFSDGKCAVKNDKGKWGFIDKEGKIKINYQFERAKGFVNGYAVVFSGTKAGIIDEDGKYIINPQYSDIIIDGDKYLIKQDNRWGWCDKSGKILINPQFDKAFPFMGNDLTPVESGEKWGYIDPDGKFSINPQFDLALPYNGKFALIASGGKIGTIDSEGKFSINPQYDEIPKDLFYYLSDGSSAYETVETDYFNITAIINRLNIKSPEGLLLTSKLSDVVDKLNITESEFSQYDRTHRVITNAKISNDANVSFYVLADAFVDIPDGWYTRKVFNTEAVVDGYAYEVVLTGRGYGKEKDVIEAIEKTISGYQRDNTESTEQLRVYKNANFILKLWINGNSVIILMEKNNISINDNEALTIDRTGDDYEEYPDVVEEYD